MGSGEKVNICLYTFTKTKIKHKNLVNMASTFFLTFPHYFEQKGSIFKGSYLM